MKSFGSYSFFKILQELIKLLPKNGKLMALIAGFSILFSLCLSSLLHYSVKFAVADMMVTLRKSNSPGRSFGPARIMGLLHLLRGDFAILLALEVTFILASSTVLFFTSISTILVSAYSYNDKNLSPKELVSILLKTWTRPVVNSFYALCLLIGYSVIVLILTSPLLMSSNLAASAVVIFIAVIFFLYLLVPWIISMVISVVEENCYGMEALGRAVVLVEGRRLHGFLLNLLHGFFISIIHKGHSMLLPKKGSVAIALMLLTMVLPLVKMFQMAAYTVLYLQCKEDCGEEIELPGRLWYNKLETANDVP